MSLAFLSDWLDALQQSSGLRVHATEHEVLFCVDPGEGPLLAIEWEPGAHALHLYAHPGHARLLPLFARAGQGSDDEDEDEEGDEGPVLDEQGEAGTGSRFDAPSGARVIHLMSNADEQRSLQLQAGTGLMTLSVRRSLASLDRMAFVALVDEVLADMALWAMLSGEGPAP
jgi:hypothetical protein